MSALAALLAIAAVHPGSFSTRIDNPWFPLRPGTTLVYRGVKDGRRTSERFAVTRRTRVLAGVRCRVVNDRVYEGAHLAERTLDYYAQRRDGSVWYFGEDTAELDAGGHVTTREGTWHTGVDGATPGLFMPAHPRVGEHHRQEYLRGHAEDEYRVVRIGATTLETHEWTRLEPHVLDLKRYRRGIGEIFEGSLRGPRETATLVRIERF